MKKVLVLLAFCFLTLSSFAYELPAGKIINKVAVQNAINNYSEKISANPETQDAYIDRAFLYYLLDDIESAIKDYDKLISIDSNNEEYYLNRGYLYHITHKREKALRDYESALRVKPDYAFAHNNRGVVLSELGRAKDSMDAYNAAIKINPNYADAYYNRGNLKTNTEKNVEALEDFNMAIKLNPSDSASFNNRGVVKRKLNYNVGALSDFSIAIKINPEDITAYANRGRLKKRFFDSEGAEEDFKSAIAVAEEDINIVKHVEAQNRAAAETEALMRDSKVASDNIQKISYNSKILSDEGNLKQAAVKASIVKVDPKSTKSTELPQPLVAKAQPEIVTKPVINPQLAECYYIRALQKYILQNREGAMKDFNCAIQHNPDYAEAYYYRAAIKRDIKDDGFVDDYRKAIQLKPELKSLAEADVLMILKI